MDHFGGSELDYVESPAMVRHSKNYTLFVHNDEIIVTPAEGVVHGLRDREYEQFMADVWVGVVLTLMVLSCICCMCSFLLYHKFQQWKINAIDGQPRPYTIESNLSDAELAALDSETLPNYTIVSGLPTYDEALEQLRQKRELRRASLIKMAEAKSQCVDIHLNDASTNRLSVAEFLQVYKNQWTVQQATPS